MYSLTMLIGGIIFLKKKTKATPQPSLIEILSDSDNFDIPDFNDELVPSNYYPDINDPPPIPPDSDLSDDEDWGLPGMDLNDPDRVCIIF